MVISIIIDIIENQDITIFLNKLSPGFTVIFFNNKDLSIVQMPRGTNNID